MMKQAKKLPGLLGIITGILLTGCYKTIVRSGAPAAPATAAYDGKWHHGFVIGLVEASNVDLAKACPDGWAEVETHTGFVQGLLGNVTYSLYSPQTVTVRCSDTAPTTTAPSPK